MARTDGYWCFSYGVDRERIAMSTPDKDTIKTLIADNLRMRNEIERILGQRIENMKLYGARMSEDEANNLAVQALEALAETNRKSEELTK